HAFVADEEIGAAAEDPDGDVALEGGAEGGGELSGGPGFDEEIGGTADLHGGVGPERLAEADGNHPFLEERVESVDGDHLALPPSRPEPGRRSEHPDHNI